ELSRYDAGTAQVFGEAGYRFAFKRASLEPFAQVAHVRLHTDGFQEHGGAADLDGMGETRSVSYSTLGARAASNFALHSGQSFAVQGLPIARNALAADAGLTVQLAKHASFDLSWQGQLARHAVDSGF